MCVACSAPVVQALQSPNRTKFSTRRYEENEAQAFEDHPGSQMSLPTFTWSLTDLWVALSM